MMEIIISQNENQNITVENESIQNINISQNENQNINIQNTIPQELNIEQERNQTILIDGGGNVYGITDVLVNGVSVVSDNIAYVIVPTKTSELLNNSGFITNENDPTVPSYVKAISLADINNWNNKQDELVSGSTIKTINNTSLLGSGNINIGGENYTAGYGIDITNNEISNTIVSYDDLEDLPIIPTKTSDLQNDSDYVTESELSDVAFSGSYADLSNTPDIPDSTSELVNDSGFIDKNVNDLTYYTKTADLGAVALSNSYNDLDNKPTIPTKTSDLNNDSGFIDKNVNDLTNYTLSSQIGAIHWIQQSDVSGTITNGTGNVKLTPYLSSDGNMLKIVQNGDTKLTSYTSGTTTTIAFNMGISPLHEGRSQCLFKDFTNNNATNLQSCNVVYKTNGTIEISIYHNNTGSNGRVWIIGDVEFYLK